MIRDSDVAIIGMACRFPGAENVGEFWKNLCDGRETTTFFSDEELAAAGVDAELLRDPRYVKAGQVLPDADMFDAGLFGIPRETAEILDPQQRHFLECALAALEDAGHDPDTYPGSIAVFAGAGMNTYAWHALADRFRRGSAVDRYQLMLASDKDYLSTRVSYTLGLRGPSVNVNTACSTSLVAVHMACLSLLSGECDVVLAGSAHIKVPQAEGYLYQEGMIFSPDGRCRAFDAKAQGTIIGSGIGVVVLRRLRDAMADGDQIHAVIKGTAVNNDGGLKVGYTAPSVEGQAAVIADAHTVADCRPETISYVEAHGTGTAIGDPVEVAALNRAFSLSAQRAGSCPLGSVKTNVGHLDTAAGMAGLIKTALMIRDGLLVPSLNFVTPNPNIDFAAGPFYVNTEFTKWPAGTSPRRAGVSAFGIGGTNAHVILEEPPSLPPVTVPTRPELLVLSADTTEGLDRATANLARHLRRHSELPLLDVAGTLALGRRRRWQRRVVVGAGVGDAALALALGDRERVFSGGTERSGEAVAFVCAGSRPGGAAHPAALYREQPEFAEAVDGCLAEAGGGDAIATLTAGDAVAAALAEYALAKLWAAWGVQPAAVIGLGDGWRAAGCLAGVFGAGAMLDPALDLPPAGSPGLPVWLSVTGRWYRPGAALQALRRESAPGPDAGGADPVASALRDTGWTPLALQPPAGVVAEPGLPALLTGVGQAWLAGAGIDWARFYAGRPVRRVPLPASPLHRRRYWLEGHAVATTTGPATNGTLSERLAGRPGAEKAALLIRYLQEEIARAIGFEQLGGELPDDDGDLFDMGAESLMLIEITAKLSDELRCLIPSSMFVDYPTIRSYVENLGELVEF